MEKESQYSLAGKTAWVGGASQGIGEACVLALAGKGARIVAMARNESRLSAIMASLPSPAEGMHAYLSIDFSDNANFKTKVMQGIATLGAADIIINNTGGPAGGTLNEADAEWLINAFHQHTIANHLLMQAHLSHMQQKGWGRIINIISTSVKQPLPGLGVSNSIRASVANWAKTLAMELAPYGITVNNVLPGATATPRLHTLIENKASKSGKSVPDIKAEMLSEIPAGRFAQPREIAYAVAFLASPMADYINGINLPVDGGRTLCL